MAAASEHWLWKFWETHADLKSDEHRWSHLFKTTRLELGEAGTTTQISWPAAQSHFTWLHLSKNTFLQERWKSWATSWLGRRHGSFSSHPEGKTMLYPVFSSPLQRPLPLHGFVSTLNSVTSWCTRKMSRFPSSVEPLGNSKCCCLWTVGSDNSHSAGVCGATQ